MSPLTHRGRMMHIYQFWYITNRASRNNCRWNAKHDPTVLIQKMSSTKWGTLCLGLNNISRMTRIVTACLVIDSYTNSGMISQDVIKWNICRVTGPLRGESNGHRWIPLTKASGAELWCFLWSAPDETVEQTFETPVIWDAIAFIMASL